MNERSARRDEALQASRRFPRLNRKQDLTLRELIVASLEEAGGVLSCDNLDALCDHLMDRFSAQLKLTSGIVNRRFHFMQNAGGVEFVHHSASGLVCVTAVKMLDRGKCLEQPTRQVAPAVSYPPDARRRRIEAILALLREQRSVVNIAQTLMKLREQHPGIGSQWIWYQTMYDLEREGRVRITPIKRGQRKVEFIRETPIRSPATERKGVGAKRSDSAAAPRDNRMPTRDELVARRAELERTQRETTSEIARIDKILKRLDDLAAYMKRELGD